MAEITKNPEPKILQTPRGPVEYAEYGEGPAILCLHGAMGGYDQSLLLARTVGGEGYRFIGVSRPGYLRTPLKSGKTSEEQADLLADLLDTLGVKKTAVMAVSGGGPNAIHFALRHRERCWGLVLVSTTGEVVDTPIPFAFQVFKLIARIPWFSTMMKKKAGKDPDKAARPSIADPAVRARTLKDPQAGPLLMELILSTFDRMHLRLTGTENDIRVTQTTDFPLEKVAVPTLVIHGTADRMVPFEKHGKVLGERIPGAELLTIEGGEHVSIFTNREEAKKRVRKFLRANAPKG